MDIITALDYNPKRHTLKKLLSKYFSNCTQRPLLVRSAIEDAMQDNNLLQALADVLGAKWRSLHLMETLLTPTVAQCVIIPISGRDVRDGVNVSFNVICYLLTDKQDNRLTLFLGQNNEGVISDMVIGYRGEAKLFESHCKLLNLSELEVYSNAHLYEPDDE